MTDSEPKDDSALFVSPTSLCQLEISISDADLALRFYRDVFGWKPVPAEIHQYIVMDVPRDCPFGIALVPGPTSGQTRTGGIVPYFAVAGPERVVLAAEKAGGRRILGPHSLAGYGTIYQIEDLDGNRFGLYQAQKPWDALMDTTG